MTEERIPLLTVEDLSVEFRTRSGIVKALDRINLTAHKGEIVGIVGESGSGKSVTSFAIMGLLDAAARISSGRIEFGGLDLLKAASSELAEMRGRELSMIFQNPRAALNPIRPVGRQIADVLLRHGSVTRANAMTKAIEALAQVGIPDPTRRAKAYPFEMSGGMCQRVMIALALACEPALLIADEPTTGLDVTTQAVIMDTIVDLAKRRHMATLLITHDLGLATEYCDRIVVMHAGHVVEDATTAELFMTPRHPYTRPTDRRDTPPRRRPFDLVRDPRRPARFAPSGPAALSLQRPMRALYGGRVRPASAARPCRGGPSGRVLEALMTALLEVESLAKRFALPKSSLFSKAPPSQVHAVADVSFEIAAGETVGLVGESGCGKSTLVRLVTRLLDPSEGAIRFDGTDLAALPARSFGSTPWRARIQMIFQDAGESLNPRYTAADAIGDPLRRLRQLSGAALKAKVEEVAQLCGFPVEMLGRFPHQLSGGQRARVGIARAVAVEPQLLILDEPTAALDVSVQVVILRLLEDLKRRLGMSYLFVSHDLNLVRLICDRVLVMYLGKMVESGPADAMFRDPAHPYTKALISAIPNFAPGVKTIRDRLDGEPRSPIDPDPAVCRFYGRCPKGQDLCRTQMPPLVPVGNGRLAACHFPEAVPEAVEPFFTRESAA